MDASLEPQPAPRRIALIDLGERESDLLPALLERAECTIELAVAERAEEPWLRTLADRGVPWTTDLAEITRHVFDEALVGAASPRRDRVETLMRAIGARMMLADDLVPRTPSAGSPGLKLIPGTGGAASTTPTPDDPAAIENWLADLTAETEASGARLVRAGSRRRVVAHVGQADPMLETLSSLALQLAQPQIVSRLDGAEHGRISGSWPITTPFFAGALAASGLSSDAARERWEQAALDLERACGRRPGHCEPGRTDWLSPSEFLSRVRLAIGEGGEERHSLHRLQFEGPPSAIEIFCRGIHSRLRDSDILCRPAPDQVLLLCGGTPAEFIHVRRRLADLWDETCRASGLPPTMLMSDERIEMSSPTGAALMFAAATGWTQPDHHPRAARS